MDIAKIIYISLTVLIAWVFMSTAFPIDTYKHLLGVIGSYICVGCSALFSSWFAWYWVHPFSYVKYLLCGLLTTFLFHAGLTIGCSIPIIILSCRGVHVISTTPITLWQVLSYILSIFIMSFYFVGLFTLGLCLLTANITKIIVWRLNISNNITNNAG
jgi:hypothetical protein